MPVSSVSVNLESAPLLPASQELPSHRRLVLAILWSLALHGVLLSLQFGFPGLSLPWSSRDQPLPPLTLRLSPAAAPPEVVVADASTPARALPPAEAPTPAPAPTAVTPTGVAGGISPAAPRSPVTSRPAPDAAALPSPRTTLALSATVIAVAPSAVLEFAVPPAVEAVSRNKTSAEKVSAAPPAPLAAPVNVDAPTKVEPATKSLSAPLAVPASSLAPVFQAQAQAERERNARDAQRSAQLQAEKAQAAQALAIAEIKQAQHIAQQQAQAQAAMQARQLQQAQLAQQQVEETLQRQRAAQLAAEQAQQEAAHSARIAEEQAA